MATSQPRLLIRNIASRFTLSANPSLLSGAPESNLLLPDRLKTARSSSLAAQEYKGTCADAQTMNMLMLGMTNVTQNETVVLQLYSDTAWTTQVYTSGSVTAFPYTGFSAAHTQADAEFLIFRSIVFYFTRRTDVKSWKVTRTDGSPANADGYFDASQLHCGEYWQFANYPALSGPQVSVPSATTSRRMDDGTLRSNKGDNWLAIELAQDKMDSADWKELQQAAIYLGTDREFFFSLFPGDGTFEEAHHQGIVKFVADTGWDRYNPLHKRTRLVMQGI